MAKFYFLKKISLVTFSMLIWCHSYIYFCFTLVLTFIHIILFRFLLVALEIFIFTMIPANFLSGFVLNHRYSTIETEGKSEEPGVRRNKPFFLMLFSLVALYIWAALTGFTELSKGRNTWNWEGSWWGV